MASTFYLFKDTTNTTRAVVRMSSVDPTPLMSGRRKTEVLIPSGAPLGTILSQMQALNAELMGLAGDETFVQVTMDTVDPAALQGGGPS